MIKLHIRQDDLVDGSYPIRLTLKRAGQPDLEAEAKISFALTDQEQNDLRWYLEDYLHRPGDAETIVAQQVEAMILARGEELYEKVLAANDNTRALWFSVRNDVASLRVEIATGVAEAASVPWELMRDPKLKSPISLRAKSFVRVQSNPNISFVKIPEAPDGRVRLLYIASRPGGASDVELRAVANRLIHDLDQERSRFDIKALRPPTFEQLQKELNDAREADHPYHIVHFDGHGTYEDLSKTRLAHWVATLPGNQEERERGYLLFEHSGDDGVRPIDGETLGKLLHDSGVPVLVLNACQSAMHEAKGQSNSALDVHDEVRAIGSLAQAVIDQGIPVVLGMRYSVFVVTAAQYIGQLYAALAKGRSFGQAATEGRKHLQLNPERWVGLEPHPLQDWFVPIAYEATPIELLSAKQSISLEEQIELDPVQKNSALLRYVPEEGFIGRDETLLALDRAFDDHRVVLLHAYAGQGKSSTAVEFARWYALTGGLGDQPVVLLASFERHTDLDDLLNQIAQTFASALEAQGIQWSALNEPEKRRRVVIQIFRLFPTLWIWDNVEPVAGFPEGSESQWTPEEQNELRDFLKQIKLDGGSKVQILLTSRRDEQRWLGGVPKRIKMPHMRNSDAARLALKLGEEKKLTRSEIAQWQPLLDYCTGNPLTLRILVGQAANAKFFDKQRIADFIAAIRSGEQEMEDADETQGRDRSLGASLNYGFSNAFKEDELCVISLLHLFQGTVDLDVLEAMGRLNEALPELKNETREHLASLLERASDIGLLTQLTDTIFTIHPAVPWFLRQTFGGRYNGENGKSSAQRALRSWTEAIAAWATYYHAQFTDGNRNAVRFLQLEEPNLLVAYRVAFNHQWWSTLILCMQGFRALYEYQGRITEWARLVEEIRLKYLTSEDNPLTDREDEYSLVMEYRVLLAMDHERDIEKAAALQEKLVAWCRLREAAVVAVPQDVTLDDVQRRSLRSLIIAIERLSHIQRDRGEITCIESYKEAIALTKRIHDKTEEAILEFNLGNAYLQIDEIRNLDAAEAAYRRSLSLCDPKDALGNCRCNAQIGSVYHQRFLEGLAAKKLVEELVEYLTIAEKHLLRALEVCPNDSIRDLSGLHGILGMFYLDVGQFQKAREHHEQAAKYCEIMGDFFGAGHARQNIAAMYLQAAAKEEQVLQKRTFLVRARAYAESALRDFKHYQGRAANDESTAHEIINEIDQILEELVPKK